MAPPEHNMQIQLVRHATMVVEFPGARLLVDPMLSEPGTMPPVENSTNLRPNPLLPLPAPAAEVLRGVTAALITHTHRDHFDDTSARLLPKELPLFVQPEDESKFRSLGFTDVHAVRDKVHWESIEIHRTGGQHGTGEVGRKMAPVSGFVLRAPGDKTLYIAGDTIWCPEVEQALATHQPAVTVVNAGAAKFLEGGPITMTAEDVVTVARQAPGTVIVAVHMEANNHCLLTRVDLAFQLEAERVSARLRIPHDGEWLTF